MKSKRQNKILELIAEHDIETQEELVNYLVETGFRVTQATISRDIKELKLVKVQSGAGSYKYSVNKKHQGQDIDVLMRIFKDTVVAIDYAVNLVVIKTLTGSAAAAAEAIDSLHYGEILGTIAGDNTIFIATTSADASAEMAARFSKLLSQ